MSGGASPKRQKLGECATKSNTQKTSTEINSNTHLLKIDKDTQIDVKEEFPSTSSTNISGDSTSQVLDIEPIKEKPTIKPNRPTCWSEKQLKYFQKENKWLRVKDGKLGCHYCIEVSKLKVKKVAISSKWTTYKITHYGETLLQQQRSLRKKVFEHRKSIAHRVCHNILEPKRKILETGSFVPMPNAMCVIPENPLFPIRIYKSYNTDPLVSNDDSYRNVMQNNELIVFPLQSHIKEEPEESCEVNTDDNVGQKASDNHAFQDELPVHSEIIVNNSRNQKEDDRVSNDSCENSEKVINKDEKAKMLRLMYSIIKQNHPLDSITNEITLQKLNGCYFGNLAENQDICDGICSHIALEMRKKLIHQMHENKSKFSLIIEECTSISEKPVLIIHLRTYFFNDDIPVDIFLDILTVDCMKSRDIVTSLLDYLKLWNFDSENQLICIGIDGTSSCLGVNSVVSTVLHEIYRNIILWNCQNHSLERSVGDYLENKLKTNCFKNFIDKLYKLYSKSLKTQTQFSKWFPDLGVQFSKVGKIINVRCIASSFKTVKAVWNAYSKLNKYFCGASEDNLREPEDVLLFKELKTQISSITFVKNLGILYDSLQELKELSMEIGTGSLVDAHRSISRQINVFDSMIYTPGPMSKKANEAIDASKFGNVRLHNSKEYDTEIDRQPFLESIKESLSKRLLSNDSMTFFEVPAKAQTNDYNIIEKIKIFQLKYWPSFWSATYGENEINSLCQRFNLDSRPIIRSYREYKETNGRIANDSLRNLLKIIYTFPVSTIYCKKVYLQMDSILRVHGNIPINYLSDILFIQLNGPPLKQFNANTYLDSWLEQDNELQVENRVRIHKEEEDKAIWKIF